MSQNRNVKYPGIRVTTNGNQLVALHTEARLVDAGIFYPITPSTEMGENFEMSFAKGELNVFGGAKIAIEAEGEHAAQGGAIAFSVTGKRVVNFTSGQGVVYGLEQYYHAPGKFSTMVLEVAARPFTKHALNVHCGHDDVYCALDTGWIILFAKDAQQAADQALILRRVTELSLTPGINAQDGFLTSHLERTFLKAEAGLIREFLGRAEDLIDCPTPAQKELFGPTRRRVPENYDLKSPVILGSVQNQEHYMNGVAGRRNHFSEPLLGFLEKAYREFGELTGRYYGLLSEYNTEKADTVFVSMGSSAENIEAAIDYIRKRDGLDAGVIHVNVLRPFPEEAIIRSLWGKKNVIVLERTDDQLAGDNPLTRDIRNALAKAEANARANVYSHLPRLENFVMPDIYSGVYGLGSRDFRPEGILGAYEFVLKGRKRKDGRSAKDGERFFYVGVDHPYAVCSEDTPSLLPEGSIAVRFHSIGGWGAITTGKNLSEIIGELGDYSSQRDFPGQGREVLHVSANPKYGSEKKGAPTNYFLVVAPERIRVNCDLRHVDVVLCCDPKAFTHTDPLSGLRPGGAMIWENAEKDPVLAWQRIPKKYRKEIIDKKIRIYTLDGFDIAAKATALKDLQLRMQGNSFLGAFFKVSPFLKEYRIPDEEFLRIVEAQYHKKFGKLGEGVIQSNMTVMREGFSRVRELPHGDPEAPDTSRMIGDILAPCGEKKLSGKDVPPDARMPFHSREMFNREFMAGLGYDQPASAYASTGVIAPATGKDMSKLVARRAVPKFIAEKCTQCMKCIVACPDTALPNTAQEIGTVVAQALRNYVARKDDQELLLKAFSKAEYAIRQTMLEESGKKGAAEPFHMILRRSLERVLKEDPEFRARDLSGSAAELFAIVEKLPLAYSMALQIFAAKEKKEPGSGGLFSIFVSDLCKGCGQCVVECGDHEALEMVPETDDVTARLHAGMEFLKLLSETPREYLGLYDPEKPGDAKAAVLQYHLMQRAKYAALVSGEGACAGCGEKTVLHMLASVTEAYLRPLFHAKAGRLAEKAKKLRESGFESLNALEKENPQGYAIFRRTVAHLVMGCGGESPEDTQGRIEREFKGGDRELIDALAAVMERDAFNHRELRAVEGMSAKGMCVMGMTANTGCPTVYGSTPPANPHPYPWMNSLFQDGATIGWLVAESFVQNHARRSVLPERFADAVLTGFKAKNAPLTEEDYFFYTHFTDAGMTDREVAELPKVWAVGGDGGLGDIGYQNLSKSVLQNRPNFKALMLDTQVYSNTGGQNSDSSPMPGGFDMNQFGRASQGKWTERKEVAQSMTVGHGSAFVAQVSMANPAGLMKALVDGLAYRGAAFVQAYTTCQPEHGVGDSGSTEQARRARDSRGFPEFTYDPSGGEEDKVRFNIKGNPAIGRDWAVRTNKETNESYFYTPAQWAVTENRFRNHVRLKVSDDYRKTGVFLDDILFRITQQDVVYRRVLDPEHISYVPPFGVYSFVEMPGGAVKPFLMSRQMVLYCVERRKNWRLLQSRAGVANEDHEAQKKVLAKFAKGEIPREEFLARTRELIEEAKKSPA